MITLEDILKRVDYLEDNYLLKFTTTATYLDTLTDEYCKFSINSKSTINIDFKIKFRKMNITDGDAIKRLTLERLDRYDKKYRIDEYDTLLIHIKDTKTLFIATDTIECILRCLYQEVFEKDKDHLTEDEINAHTLSYSKFRDIILKMD